MICSNIPYYSMNSEYTLLDHLSQLSQDPDGEGEQCHGSGLMCGGQRSGNIEQQGTNAQNHLRISSENTHYISTIIYEG